MQIYVYLSCIHKYLSDLLCGQCTTPRNFFVQKEHKAGYQFHSSYVHIKHDNKYATTTHRAHQ